MVLLRLTGPTWKWEKTEHSIIQGSVQQAVTHLLLRVKRRAMTERMRFGKMLIRNHVRTGTQIVFRNADKSPQ